MNRLAPLSFRDIREILINNGFRLVSQKGSHFKYKDRMGKTAIVPNQKDITVGVIKSIMEQTGLSRKDFIK